MRAFDAAGRAKAYVDVPGPVRLERCAAVTKLSFEAACAPQPADGVALALGDATAADHKATQFLFYSNATLQYIINNRDCRGEYFSLISRARYILLSSPRQLGDFISYAVDGSYAAGGHWAVGPVSGSITIILNNLQSLVDDTVVNRSFHALPDYVSTSDSPQHALEFETYKRLTAHYRNVWFDVNEDRSFHLIQNLLRQDEGLQLKFEWLVVKTPEQFNFVVQHRHRFSAIEEFRLIMRGHVIQLDTIQPILQSVHEFSSACRTVVDDQQTAETVLRVRSYAVKELEIVVDKISGPTVQQLVLQNAQWIGSTVSLVCNTNLEENVGKLVQMPDAVVEKVAVVYFNDDLRDSQLRLLKGKYCDKFNLNDITQQSQTLNNQQVLLNFKQQKRQIDQLQTESKAMKCRVDQCEATIAEQNNNIQDLRRQISELRQACRAGVRTPDNKSSQSGPVQSLGASDNKTLSQRQESTSMPENTLKRAVPEDLASVIQKIEVTLSQGVDAKQHLQILRRQFGEKVTLSPETQVADLQVRVRKLKLKKQVLQQKLKETQQLQGSHTSEKPQTPRSIRLRYKKE